MSSSTPSVFVTKEQVAKWRTEADEHERMTGLLRRKAMAGEQLLRAMEMEGADETKGDVGPFFQKDVATNFMGAIRDVANKASKPLPKKDLRKVLLDKGFPSEQVNSAYFYVAISKLNKNEEISVTDTGAVWKGKKP